MIIMKEIIKDLDITKLPKEHQDNLAKLLIIANNIRTLWDKPLIVTSGYRSYEDQIRIYKQKGITDLSKIPMKSFHLCGAAIDFSDPDLSMTKWLENNPKIMEGCNIFCEKGNSNWVHMQILPFGSYKAGGTRWFNP